MMKATTHAIDGNQPSTEDLHQLLGDGLVDDAGIAFSDIEAHSLQEARLYAEAIVNTVREPLLVLDGDLRVHSINSSFSTLFQVSSQEVLGRSLRHLDKGVWEIPRLLTMLKAVLEDGASIDEFEVSYDSAVRGQRALLLNARTLHRRGERSDLILVAIDDVTERRRLQTLLNENEERLREEERMSQRRLELNNALRVSTVGELAAGLAHEINQPLSSISNLVEACAQHVRAGNLDPTRHLALLSDIADEALRAAGIVAHLRSFVDKGEPQLELVELSDIVTRVPQLLLRELERIGITLRITLPKQQLFVDADSIQIQQVVVNLIQNAMDSIREAEHPHRLIELTVGSSDGMAEVSVRDTGTGVSEPAAERMFKPFFTTKTEGLGMGLALSRSILEAHQGGIRMEAPADGGAGIVVRFTIPLKSSTEDSQGESS